MQRSRILALVLFLFVILVCHDVISYLKYNKSFIRGTVYQVASKILWTVHSVQYKDANSCYETFMLLLANYTISGKYFLLEPNPAIPIDTIKVRACREHFIAKPPPSWVTKTNLKCFHRRVVKDSDRPRIRESLLVVKKLFEKNNIPLIVYGGSLIGSWRYHGMIPYDDDFDFRFPRVHIKKVKSLLTQLSKNDPRFTYTDTDKKLGHLQANIACLNRTRCPSFVDFFYYWPEGSNLRVLEWPRLYPKTMFFPLTKRPLEGQLYDAVRDFPNYFKLYYKPPDPSVCVSVDHNRNVRSGCKPLKCSYLNTFLPFMVTSESSKGRLELVVNASHIRSIFYQRKRP